MDLLKISVAPAASIEPDDLVWFELHSCVLIHILNSSVDNVFLFNEDSQDIYHHDKHSQLYLKMNDLIYVMSREQRHVITQ